MIDLRYRIDFDVAANKKRESIAKSEGQFNHEPIVIQMIEGIIAGDNHGSLQIDSSEVLSSSRSDVCWSQIREFIIIGDESHPFDG